MIDFLKSRKIFYTLSLLILLPSLFFLATRGLVPSIDFTGGSLLEVTVPNNLEVNTEQLANDVKTVNGVEVSSVQLSDSLGKKSVVLKLNDIQEASKDEILTKITALVTDEEQKKEVVTERFETIGPILGKELLIKTVIAVILVSLIILWYVARQFKNPLFGISAILAMLHDTFILLGIFSMLGYFYKIEVDTLFVTALLTTLSFSVHDTIVVFDRVREILKDKISDNFDEAINMSINQTLPRSLNNSVTIILMLTALTFLGGETIRYFVLALLIGTVAGTYSSTFTAAPLLADLTKRFKQTIEDLRQ